MINFQRIINDYKEAKRKTAKDIADHFSFIKEDPRLSSFSPDLGLFVANIERDLGKEIPLLRKTKERLRRVKQHLRENNIAAAMDYLCEAEKFFLEFKEKELEKKLKTALSKHLKEIQL